MLTVNHLSGFAAGRSGIDGFVKLMMHCDGADGSATFVDSSLSPRTLTASGNAQVDTAQARFGGGALLCDGDGDYVSAASASDFDLGSGDFTFDCWVRCQNNTEPAGVIFSRGAGYCGCIAAQNGSTFNLYSSSTGTSWNLASATVIGNVTANVWTHLAQCRVGGNLYCFQDGVLQATVSVSGALYDPAAAFKVGEQASGSCFVGWIDEFRFSKGIGRWTAAFTPPVRAYS